MALQRKYLEFCLSHSLEHIITRPTRMTDQAATSIDHMLKKQLIKSANQGL